MRYIKIIMSKGESLTVSEEKAIKILDGDGQLVKIYDEKNEWTGETINKAHIVSTFVDREATR